MTTPLPRRPMRPTRSRNHPGSLAEYRTPVTPAKFAKSSASGSPRLAAAIFNEHLGNSADQSDRICSNCIDIDIKCTHDTAPKKRGVRNYTRQVTELQNRIRELEDALKEARATKSLPSADTEMNVTPESVDTPPEQLEEDEDLEYMEMLEALKKASLNGHDGRYFGPSSTIYFMRRLVQDGPPVDLTTAGKFTTHPWENEGREPDLVFPDEDLLDSLLDLYKEHTPSWVAVIHWPSFRRSVDAGLHLVDRSFGELVLATCALGARISNDTRVLYDGGSWYSAGWKYYTQTFVTRVSPLRVPTIYDIQTLCHAAAFLVGTSTPQAGSAPIGIASRYIVELGLHRHVPGGPTVESELRKRVFWSVFLIDRHTAIYTGRPFNLRDEDFDVESLIDCDDEYWETGNPATDFKQPVGRPSRISAFCIHIQLAQITSVALRTLYGIKKSRIAAGITESESIAVLDSMLNNWFNQIPDHLRWDPTRTPNPFYKESAITYMIYYNLQIHLHRTFIHKQTPQALPSMAICTHAARSVGRILDSWLQRRPVSSFLINLVAFGAGSILVMNIRRRRKANMSMALGGQDTIDLYKVLNTLQIGQPRYSVCGQLIHTLTVLAGLPSSMDTFPVNQAISSSILSGYSTGIAAQPNLSDLDPILFGLRPKEEEVQPSFDWNTMGQAQVDTSLFDDDAVAMWADNGPYAWDSNWNGVNPGAVQLPLEASYF